MSKWLKNLRVITGSASIVATLAACSQGAGVTFHQPKPTTLQGVPGAEIVSGAQNALSLNANYKVQSSSGVYTSQISNTTPNGYRIDHSLDGDVLSGQ